MITPKRIARVFSKLRRRLAVAWRVWQGFDDALARSRTKPSFSQCGEDMIVWFLLDHVGIRRPSYIDIGAHHPTHLSNTALFYLLGGRGINIEPDPQLFREFVTGRKQDINLNIGIGGKPGELIFHRMADPSLSTFSADEAVRMESVEGIAIVERLPLPVCTINEVMQTHRLLPDFVSVDVEGNDLEILQSFDFKAHRPAVFCVETISFSLSNAGRKNVEIMAFLARQGYEVYADTYINTIFVDRQRFSDAKVV